VTPDRRTSGRWRGWSSQSVARAWQFEFFYALVRLGGQRLSYFFVRLIAPYYVFVRVGIAKRSEPYLRRRFPSASWLRRRWHCLRQFNALGETILDKAIAGLRGLPLMEANPDLQRHLQAVAAEGKGLFIVTAHVGCWQVALSSLDFLTGPVNMVMYRDEGDHERDVSAHAGREPPYRVIDPAGAFGGAIEIVDRLARGEVVCVMGDRLMRPETPAVAVPFLGASARFPTGVYRLAALAGAPLLILFSHKTSSGAYRVEMAGEVRLPVAAAHQPEAWTQCARQFAAALADYTEHYPYQFFNFYDMWAH
jgi:predicted LPLAT superfamily acyltransferase